MPFALAWGGLPKGLRPADAHCIVMMPYHLQWGTVHPKLRELEAAMVRVESEEIEPMACWYRQRFPSLGG